MRARSLSHHHARVFGHPWQWCSHPRITRTLNPTRCHRWCFSRACASARPKGPACSVPWEDVHRRSSWHGGQLRHHGAKRFSSPSVLPTGDYIQRHRAQAGLRRWAVRRRCGCGSCSCFRLRLRLRLWFGDVGTCDWLWFRRVGLGLGLRCIGIGLHDNGNGNDYDNNNDNDNVATSLQTLSGGNLHGP